MHLLPCPEDDWLKIDGEQSMRSEICPKSHCYSPGQPEPLILHCTPDGLWGTGNAHSRQGWRGQE